MKEVACVIRSLGYSPLEADIRAIVLDLESGGQRTFDINEVTKIITQRIPRKENPEVLREAFRIFDRDGNGYVSAAEMRHVLTTLGEKLKDEEVDELIREADITGDGQISYEEFVKILHEGQ